MSFALMVLDRNQSRKEYLYQAKSPILAPKFNKSVKECTTELNSYHVNTTTGEFASGLDSKESQENQASSDYRAVTKAN